MAGEWNDEIGYGAGVPAPSLPPHIRGPANESPIFDIIRNPQNYQPNPMNGQSERDAAIYSLMEQNIPAEIAQMIFDSYSGEWIQSDPMTRIWQPMGGKVQAEDGSWVPLSFYAQAPVAPRGIGANSSGYNVGVGRNSAAPSWSPAAAPAAPKSAAPMMMDPRAGKSAMPPSFAAMAPGPDNPMWKQKAAVPAPPVDYSYQSPRSELAATFYGGEVPQAVGQTPAEKIAELYQRLQSISRQGMGPGR